MSVVLEPDEIRTISAAEFDEVIDELGAIDSWQEEQLDALTEVAKKVRTNTSPSSGLITHVQSNDQKTHHVGVFIKTT